MPRNRAPDPRLPAREPRIEGDSGAVRSSRIPASPDRLAVRGPSTAKANGGPSPAPAASGPAGPSGIIRPSGRTLAVLAVAAVATLGHALIGVPTLLLLALTPSEPSRAVTLASLQVLAAVGWVAFLALIALLTVKGSFRVILVPAASAAWFVFIALVEGSTNAGVLNYGP